MPENAYPYDLPCHGSSRTIRIATSSGNKQNVGGMTRAAFMSTSSRFSEKSERRSGRGRDEAGDSNSVAKVDAKDNSAVDRGSHNRSTKKSISSSSSTNTTNTTNTTNKNIGNDVRSEVITGMTFARALGLDPTVHKSRNQSREICSPPLLDYHPFDWRSYYEKQRDLKGFAIDKTKRLSGRFYGTCWRGCASLVPSNMPDNPTSYIKPTSVSKQSKGNIAGTSLKSNTPSRVSLDSLRLGLNAITKGKSAVGVKLGPGHYKSDEAKMIMRARGGIMNNHSKQSSSFKAKGRGGNSAEARGGRGSVFINNSNKKRAGEERKKANDEDDDEEGAADDDPFKMYQNIKPTSSLSYLQSASTNEPLQALLKREKNGGLTSSEKGIMLMVKDQARERNSKIQDRIKGTWYMCD